VVSFTPLPLYSQGEDPWYPLDRRLGGPQSRSGHGGEEKNSHTPPVLEIIHPLVQRYSTELFRVKFRDFLLNFLRLARQLRDVKRFIQLTDFSAI
jgi:hypothetical protein